jgi:hypothetical protein
MLHLCITRCQETRRSTTWTCAGYPFFFHFFHHLVYTSITFSLYPAVCKYSEMPVGHPTIITEGFKPVDRENQSYKGLIKCLVLPPRKLYHPVLPRRSEGKLTFPLCGTCVTERRQSECDHCDKDRAMWGCWTHVELYHAVDVGYVVMQVVEVYNWDEWAQYDGKDDSTGLFTAYINAFLRIKQQVSWDAYLYFFK